MMNMDYLAAAALLFMVCRPSEENRGSHIRRRAKTTGAKATLMAIVLIKTREDSEQNIIYIP